MLVPILLVLQAASAPSEKQDRLDLICMGGGSANKVDTRNVYATDNSGNSATAVVQGRRSEGFNDQVDLWIENGEGRIRMPRTMLPKLRGGDEGWFKLRDVKVADDRITASAAVNFINNPKVLIDRRTGTISIDGRSGHYTGQCQKFDPATRQRQF